MNRLITFTTGLFLATSTAAFACPRAGFQALWQLFGADQEFIGATVDPADIEAVMSDWQRSVARYGVVSVDHERGFDMLIREPLRRAEPFASETYVDLSCAIYEQQPVIEVVTFLRSPRGQHLIGYIGDDASLEHVWTEIITSPRPEDPSIEAFESVFNISEQVENDLSEDWETEYAPLMEQVNYRDLIADIFADKDIVSFETEAQRARAVQLFRQVRD